MSDSLSSYDISHDHEYDVLAHIHQHEKVKQRDIATAIGLSLGMTNAILKRLANKGLITMRRINSRNIHYLVTPNGVDEIAKRSYRYLRRTVGHVVRYKEQLRGLLRHAAMDPPEGRGITRVVLIGESDLDFLVEWCAEKEGLAYKKEPGGVGVSKSISAPGVDFLVASESLGRDDSVPASQAGTYTWDVHLADLVVGSGR